MTSIRQTPYVLIVKQQLFQSGWMGATRRVFDIAEAFNHLGFEVFALTGKRTNSSIQSKIDSQFPGFVLRTEHTGWYPRLVDTPLLRRAWRGVWRLKGQYYYWSRLSWGWGDRLDVQQVVAVLRRQGVLPALIWGICSGELGGVVAARRLAEAFGVPHVIEMHDPPDGAGVGPEIEVVKRRFASEVVSATHIVVTAASYGRKLESSFGVSPKKWSAIHLTHKGFQQGDENHFGRNASRSNFFVLSYTGTLGGYRSLVPLARAIRELVNRWPETGESLRLQLAGRGPGFDEIERFMESIGLKQHVRYFGSLNGQDVQQFHDAASVVVIVQPNAYKYQIPGKVYESLVARKPIVGIMPWESEAAVILAKSGMGFVHDPDDLEGLVKTLWQLWSAWKRGQTLINPRVDFIERFSYSHVPRKVAEMLRGIIDIPAVVSSRRDMSGGDNLTARKIRRLPLP